ncbi:MAG: BrnA antitoxin family protein [Pseudomonadota bacterium]
MPKINGLPVTKKEVRAAFKVRQGRPPKQTHKFPVSIRGSSEVVEYFRATCKGWLTRIDER